MTMATVCHGGSLASNMGDCRPTMSDNDCRYDCGDDGDVLRLQYLTDTTIHMDDWQIDLPATADLVHAIIGDLHTWEQGEITARQERVESWRTAALQQS